MAELNEKSNMNYLNIIAGKIAKKTTKEQGGIERIKKDGTTTYEKYYTSIKGSITSLSIKDGQFGHQVSIVFDGDTNLQFSLESRYATSFLTKQIPLNTPVEIAPYDFTDKEGKKQQGISVTVDGEKLKSDWTSAPPLLEKKKAGKVVFDNTDRVNYFIEKYKSEVKSEPVKEDGDDDLAF